MEYLITVMLFLFLVYTILCFIISAYKSNEDFFKKHERYKKLLKFFPYQAGFATAIITIFCFAFSPLPQLIFFDTRAPSFTPSETIFKAMEFPLTVYIAHEGGVVYYTIDDTYPKENGMKYTEPIRGIQPGTIIRAQAKLAFNKWSDEARIKLVIEEPAEYSTDMHIINARFAFVTRDYGDARVLYEKVSIRGDESAAEALCQLGYIYSQALGVPRDREKAMTYYRDAAKLGSELAMKNLLAMNINHVYSGRTIADNIVFINEYGTKDVKLLAKELMTKGTENEALDVDEYLGFFSTLSEAEQVNAVNARTEWFYAGMRQFISPKLSTEFLFYELVDISQELVPSFHFMGGNETTVYTYNVFLLRFIDNCSLVEESAV